MARTIFRVLPDSGDWKVTRNTVRQRGFTLKADAITWGRGQAQNSQPSQLVIHKADGTIETEYTYGDDPFPPPG